MRSWLLIEQPGPWPADALERVLAEAFPADRNPLLRQLSGSHGLRTLLIRRPGRHLREPRLRRRTVLVGGGEPGNRWLEHIAIDDLRELADLDLVTLANGSGGVGEPVSGPIFLVCTHGTKDMCCAVFGRPLADALGANHPDRTWEVSHVGGDRWAGNLLVVPDGYLHGHLDPDEAARIAKAALDGHVELEHLRGRTTTANRWAQHAEIAVRQHLGARGLDEVLAIGDAAVPAGSSDSTVRLVRVRGAGRLFDVIIRHRAAGGPVANRCAGSPTASGYVTEAIRQIPTEASA